MRYLCDSESDHDVLPVPSAMTPNEPHNIAYDHHLASSSGPGIAPMGGQLDNVRSAMP